MRGAPKHQQKQLFKLGPDKLGEGKFKFAWRPNAEKGSVALTTASLKNKNLVVHLFRRDGSVYNSHTGPGRCVARVGLQRRYSGRATQEGAGIFLWDMPPADAGDNLTVPMSLAPSIATNASFCKSGARSQRSWPSAHTKVRSLSLTKPRESCSCTRKG